MGFSRGLVLVTRPSCLLPKRSMMVRIRQALCFSFALFNSSHVRVRGGQILRAWLHRAKLLPDFHPPVFLLLLVRARAAIDDGDDEIESRLS
jgi:hypothetical protein